MKSAATSRRYTDRAREEMSSWARSAMVILGGGALLWLVLFYSLLAIYGRVGG